jgi:rhamnosyltransferase
MSPPRVSVVVPVRNGSATLRALLDAVRAQRTDADVEVVVIDSGSTDGSAELARRHGVDRVIEIRPDEFDHGATRNLGIAQSRGDLVILVVQDALPASDVWLDALVAPLVDDLAVAGSFARQVPRPDASAIAKYYLSRWVAAGDVPRTVSLSGRQEFDAMAPADRLDTCAFDNVCACLRRSVWQRHPFRRTPIGEDVAWAREVLLAGHHLAFVPEAVVVHSHDRPLAYEFRRTRDLHAVLFDLFGLRTVPTLPLLARAMAVSAAVNVRCAAARPSGIPRALGLAVAWPLAQYLGARRAAGRRTPDVREADACAS